MPATAFMNNTAFSTLTNTSNITIVQGAIQGWQNSAEGMAAVLVFMFGLIVLMGYMVYIRTNLMIPAFMVTIMLTLVVDYYSLLDIVLFGWSFSQLFMWFYIGEFVGLGISIAYKFIPRG